MKSPNHETTHGQGGPGDPGSTSLAAVERRLAATGSLIRPLSDELRARILAPTEGPATPTHSGWRRLVLPGAGLAAAAALALWAGWPREQEPAPRRPVVRVDARGLVRDPGATVLQPLSQVEAPLRDEAANLAADGTHAARFLLGRLPGSLLRNVFAARGPR